MKIYNACREIISKAYLHGRITTRRSFYTCYNIDPLERLTHKDWLSPNEVLDIFKRVNNPVTLIDVFEKFSKRKDYNINEAICTMYVQKLARAKKFVAVEEFLKRVRTEKACRLSDEFFYKVIKLHGTAGYVDRAIEILFSMREYHCWPTIRTFNYVLNLLVTSRQFDVIHDVYLGASRLGLEIDTCCLNILIKGLCESDKLDSAFALLDEFAKLECQPNVRTYSTLISCLCKLGRVDEACKLCEKMEQVGVEPDTVTFNMLISGLCKKGRVEDGMELMHKMRFKGCEPDGGSYQAVLYGLLEAKKFVEAKVLMDKMISMRVIPSFSSYKLVISGLCDEKLLDDVDFVLKRMLRQGFVPRMGMWKKILESMFSANVSSFNVSHCKVSELARSC